MRRLCPVFYDFLPFPTTFLKQVNTRYERLSYNQKKRAARVWQLSTVFDDFLPFLRFSIISQDNFSYVLIVFIIIYVAFLYFHVFGNELIWFSFIFLYVLRFAAMFCDFPHIYI